MRASLYSVRPVLRSDQSFRPLTSFEFESSSGLWRSLGTNSDDSGLRSRSMPLQLLEQGKDARPSFGRSSLVSSLRKTGIALHGPHARSFGSPRIGRFVSHDQSFRTATGRCAHPHARNIAQADRVVVCVLAVAREPRRSAQRRPHVQVSGCGLPERGWCVCRWTQGRAASRGGLRSSPAASRTVVHNRQRLGGSSSCSSSPLPYGPSSEVCT